MVYEFRFISSLHFIGVFLLTCLSTMFITVELLGPFEKFSALMLTILTLLISYLAASVTSKGKISFEIRNSEVSIHIYSKPLISRKKNLLIHANDIKSWRFRPESNFNMLNISTFSGKKIRFERSTSWTRDSDSFDKFFRKLQSLIALENNNRKARNESEIINRELEFFKGNYAKFLFFFSGLSLLFGVIIIILTWRSGKPTIIYMIPAISGTIFYML